MLKLIVLVVLMQPAVALAQEIDFESNCKTNSRLELGGDVRVLYDSDTNTIRYSDIYVRKNKADIYSVELSSTNGASITLYSENQRSSSTRLECNETATRAFCRLPNSGSKARSAQKKQHDLFCKEFSSPALAQNERESMTQPALAQNERESMTHSHAVECVSMDARLTQSTTILGAWDAALRAWFNAASATGTTTQSLEYQRYLNVRSKYNGEVERHNQLDDRFNSQCSAVGLEQTVHRQVCAGVQTGWCGSFNYD